MYLDRISRVSPETPLIARDAFARQQWEAVVAALDAPAGERAWPSRAFTSWSEWLAGRFEAAQAAAGDSPLLLGPGQVDRLWRRIIEASPAGEALIRSGGVAAWARSARRSLFEHGLAPADQGGTAWHDDAAQFLAWNREFEAVLERNGWVDADSLLYRINRLPAEAVASDLMLLDPARVTPEVERLIERSRAAGCRCDRIEPDEHRASVHGLIAADPAHEIRSAASWAAERLGERKDRLAVVIADLKARRDEVEAIFSDHLGNERVTSAGHRRLGDVAIFGAALTAIRLLTGDGGFEILSRWLRSPFFSSADEARARAAAMLEIALRSEPRAQRDFSTAWRNLGLQSRFARVLPDTASRLDRALNRLPRRATPTAWTSVWQSCLEILGWRGFEDGLPRPLQSAWDNAWARFSALTAILGPVDPGTALEALAEILAAESIYEPMGLEGVVLLSRIDQVGPGFAGAWIAGFSDEAATPADSPNPLLPWSVQAGLGMPGASPDRALADSIDDLDRLRRRVPEAVFSCPARIGDEPRMPSPLIEGWRPTAVGQGRSSRAAARIGARGWRDQVDPAPALAGTAIRGGARTLDLQSACPARAFCVARLGAEPLEPPPRGIDARLRGLLIHRVLELLLDPDRDSDRDPDPDRDPDRAGAADSRLGNAIDEAFGKLTRRGDACWDAQLRAERSRIERIAASFLEAESARPAFTTIAVERRTEIVVDGHRLRCRLDRVDRLASGGALLIDYKTGQSPPVRWFESRLGDCQLPAYALEARPAGIAAIRLDDAGVTYRWAGKARLSLPGRGRDFDDAGWDRQIARWHEQIRQLLDEFARGDVRVPSDAPEHVASDGLDRAGGAFAPLTRVGDIA